MAKTTNKLLKPEATRPAEEDLLVIFNPAI